MAENRNTNASTYNDDSIQTLAWNEHIRQRPGMYVGRFGDGSQSDDGMYVLIKEVMDNSIDEYMMGHGKTIEVTIEGRRVTIRDYGRGIPLNKLSDAVSKMNTGGKFEDSTTFRKSVGLNGVGVKAVNASPANSPSAACATARPARSASRAATSSRTAGRRGCRKKTVCG